MRRAADLVTFLMPLLRSYRCWPNNRKRAACEAARHSFQKFKDESDCHSNLTHIQNQDDLHGGYPFDRLGRREPCLKAQAGPCVVTLFVAGYRFSTGEAPF
jgi:hypothetical protein